MQSTAEGIVVGPRSNLPCSAAARRKPTNWDTAHIKWYGSGGEFSSPCKGNFSPIVANTMRDVRERDTRRVIREIRSHELTVAQARLLSKENSTP